MTNAKRYILSIGLVTLCAFCYAQVISISKAKSKITIDGILNDNAWRSVSSLKDFKMNFPRDSVDARSKTEVKITYDDKNLYIAAICQKELADDFVITTMRRDFDFSENDAFAVYIDAFNDAANGLGFAVNPLGVQSDGLIANGGVKGVTLNWDGQWQVETMRSSTNWTVEMAIPFKTLRYKSDIKNWRINFARNDRSRNEISTWKAVPRGFKVTTLSFMGLLEWTTPPKKNGANIALIPYVAGAINKDFESAESLVSYQPATGIDAKIGLSSSLNLDLTINPDFSQIEVDRQVINLQRFELSFPERRIFFLENSDLFAKLGNSRVRPFFSRRIGGVGTEPVPVLFGARLSGKLNKDWRIGLMTTQTEGVTDVAKAQNYTVATIQRRVLEGSTVSAFITNRSAFNGNNIDKNDYNLTGGVEMDFRSKNGEISAHGYLHTATTQEKLGDNFAFGAKARYRTQQGLNIFLGIDAIGENYITDLGFVPRLYNTDENGESVRIPYLQVRTNGGYRFYQPEGSTLVYWGPTYHFDIYTNKDFDFQESRADLGIEMEFINSTALKVEATTSKINLLFPFTLKGLETAFPTGIYTNIFLEAKYNTDKRRRLFGETSIGIGTEYNGQRAGFDLGLNWRYKAWGLFGFSYEYQNLYQYESVYGNPTFHLLGSSLEIAFTRDINWTTFLQYNTQNDNFNINSRFRWRFHPMSDFFLVYTDNYTTDILNVKNRAVVVKLNYWFNL